MSFPCPQGIVNIPLDVCTKHAESTWPCPRDARRVRRRAAAGAGKSAQIALASARFLDPQTGPALLICRARDVARTARTHVTHVTRRVRVTR